MLQTVSVTETPRLLIHHPVDRGWREMGLFIVVFLIPLRPF
jgi:hypothetical protein